MKKGQREILRESAASHEELLAELVRQVTWLPLPVARDPLLLRWFDEHYDIWGCAATIPADVAYLRRWHSPDSHPHPNLTLTLIPILTLTLTLALTLALTVTFALHAVITN